MPVRQIAAGVMATIALVMLGAAAGENSPAAPPRPSTALPNVHVLAPMAMPRLDRERTIRVYLPPGYEQARRRYPVLYLHDGQNLFDAATSFSGEWEIDETLNQLAATRGLALIVVGIDNGGEHRLQELAPFANARNLAPEGDAYLDFVVGVVKPYIDAHYRTKADREHTAIGGSSLGALVSHYAIYRHPQTFGKALLFSPSYWYTPAIYDFSATRRLPRATKLYFYAGDAEDENMVGNLRHMLGVLNASGFPADGLVVRVAPGAHHNEDAWRAEFPRAVAWLFGH